MRRRPVLLCAAAIALGTLTACTPPVDHTVRLGYGEPCGPWAWNTVVVTDDIVAETHGLAGVEVWASRIVGAAPLVQSYVLDPATRASSVRVPFVGSGPRLTLDLATLPEGDWYAWVTWPGGTSRNNVAIRVDRTKPRVTFTKPVALGKGVYRLTLEIDEPPGEISTELDGVRFPDTFLRDSRGHVVVDVRAFLPDQSVVVTDSSCNVSSTTLHLPLAPGAQLG